MPKMSPKEQIEKLKEKQERLKAQFAKATARAKADDRKKDTRRKILAGAVVLTACEKDEALKKQVMDLLDRNLVMNKDRMAFGLALKPEPTKNTAAKP